MKNRIENNIQHSMCVPKEVMIGYINNTLDKKSFLNVSAHLEDCEYCSEAFNGLKQVDDFSVLNSLPALWQNRTGIKTSTGSSSYISKIITGVVSLGIVIFCVLFFNNNSRVVKNESQISEQKDFLPVLNTEIKEESKANETQIINDENKTIVSQKSNKEILHPGIRKTGEEILNKIPGKEAFVLNQDYSPEINAAAIRRSALSEIIYLENLKTVNYLTRYSKSPMKLEGILNNVNAQYENKEEQNERKKESFEITYAISYEKALSNGLRNYNKGFYLQAINDFDIIVEQFPKDLNCKFYKALCYENNRKFQEAEKLFSETMNDADDSFFEEAKWHLALSKVKMEKMAEAKNIFKQIISGNGFYKSKAEAMLKELK